MKLKKSFFVFFNSFYMETIKEKPYKFKTYLILIFFKRSKQTKHTHAHELQNELLKALKVCMPRSLIELMAQLCLLDL